MQHVYCLILHFCNHVMPFIVCVFPLYIVCTKCSKMFLVMCIYFGLLTIFKLLFYMTYGIFMYLFSGVPNYCAGVPSGKNHSLSTSLISTMNTVHSEYVFTWSAFDVQHTLLWFEIVNSIRIIHPNVISISVVICTICCWYLQL